MTNFQMTLLSDELLSDRAKLDELSHWLNVMKRPQGWHYDLDEVWILRKFETEKVPAGGLVLDAGGGLGVMQYVLAARGYNVVSLDFGRREIPKEAKGIFDFDLGAHD